MPKGKLYEETLPTIQNNDNALQCLYEINLCDMFQYIFQYDNPCNCASDESMDVVTERCEGKTSCDFRANNGAFGDPCPRTRKYLEVQYQCVTSGTTTTTTSATSTTSSTTMSAIPPTAGIWYNSFHDSGINLLAKIPDILWQRRSHGWTKETTATHFGQETIGTVGTRQI